MTHLSPYICSHNSSLFTLTQTYGMLCMYVCMGEVDKHLLENHSEPFAWTRPIYLTTRQVFGTGPNICSIGYWVNGTSVELYGPAQSTWQFICYLHRQEGARVSYGIIQFMIVESVNDLIFFLFLLSQVCESQTGNEKQVAGFNHSVGSHEAK